jgi:hypothetical protein
MNQEMDNREQLTPASKAKPSQLSTDRERLRKIVLPVLRHAREQLRLGESPRLSELLDRLGPNGTSILILLLCLPFLVPVSLGPITVAVSTIVLGLAMTLLFPSLSKWINRRLDYGLNQVVVNGLRKMAAASARWRHSERRLPVIAIVGPSTRKYLLTGLVIVHAILLALPIPLLPLTNTLPALSIVLFSLAIIRHNDLYTILGFVVTVLTLAWFGLIGYVGVKGMQLILARLLGWD